MGAFDGPGRERVPTKLDSFKKEQNKSDKSEDFGKKKKKELLKYSVYHVRPLH